MQDLLNALKDFGPSAVTSAISGLGGWFAGRSRNKAELEQIQQQNKTSEFSRLNALVNELQQDSHEARNEAKELRSEMRAMRQEQITERVAFQAQIAQLKQEQATERVSSQAQILQLRSELDEVKAENERLRTDLAATQKTIAPAAIVPMVEI